MHEIDERKGAVADTALQTCEIDCIKVKRKNFVFWLKDFKLQSAVIQDDKKLFEDQIFLSASDLDLHHMHLTFRMKTLLNKYVHAVITNTVWYYLR